MRRLRLLPLLLLSGVVCLAQRDLRRETVEQLPVAEKRWALLIGVDEYDDANITSLRGAGNDARALQSVLVRYAGFPENQVIVLASGEPVERKPTRSIVLQRLSIILRMVPKDGLLLIAFSGHGMERKDRAFLLPSDARLNDDPEFLEDVSVSVNRVRQRIVEAGVKQVVVILDACRNDPGGRADSPNPLSEAFTRGFRFDVRNREVTAFVTLYATGVGDRAYENSEKKRGYFSTAIEEALAGKAANMRGEVTLSALLRYLQDTVPKAVFLDLGPERKQFPFAITEGYKAAGLVLSIVPPGNITEQQKKLQEERLKIETELTALAMERERLQGAAAQRLRRESEQKTSELEQRLRLQKLAEENLVREAERRKTLEGDEMRLLEQFSQSDPGRQRQADEAKIQELRQKLERERSNVATARMEEMTLIAAREEVSNLRQRMAGAERALNEQRRQAIEKLDEVYAPLRKAANKEAVKDM